MSAGGWLLALLAVAGPLAAAPLISDPDRADPDWHIPGPVPGTVNGTPAFPDYQRLEDVLALHQAIESAGGWPLVPTGPDLRAGVRDPRVEALRNRLRVTGDYDREMGADPWFFDGGLEEALRHFQARHGLRSTGVLDERTLAAANVPVDARIAQLQITLERWRWLPPELGTRYLWANVPAGTLDVIVGGTSVLTMRIIAGHPDRPTPSFRSEIRQVIFNPTWTVPRIIAVEDLLPEQQADRNYLPRLAIRVFSDAGPAARELDARRIDWSRLDGNHFPYKLRQDAGPGNSLGRFKFVMDNPYDIYMHDTPSRRLFDLTSRTLSSGCLRVEEPEALVNLLLGNERRWTPADTATRVARGQTQAVTLQKPVPIYIVYLTAWATPAGEVNFRPDVYGRDVRVRRSLGLPER